MELLRQKLISKAPDFRGFFYGGDFNKKYGIKYHEWGIGKYEELDYVYIGFS